MNIQKINTENIPLLDEIVYYTKVLAIDTILKDEDLALENETEESLKNSDIYIACIEGKASIYMFNYTRQDLILSGIIETDPNMNRYLSNSDYIPNEIKTKLLKLLSDRFISKYEEKNNYYRTLYGLPDYIERFIPRRYYEFIEVIDEEGIIDFSKPLHNYSIKEIEVLEKSDYFIRILKDTNSRLVEWETRKGTNVTFNRAICYNDWDYIPEDLIEDVEAYSIPSNLPMHFYSASEASTLEYVDVIDYFKDEFPEKKYINFIGEKKITPYEARKIENFGIIHIPRISVEEVRNRYYERILLNRDFVVRTVYSEAYKLRSTHYNDFIKLYIIILSMADMMSLSTEFIIKRELFDIRTIEFLLTSYGITFFSDIPLRYQQKIVKKLNSLLKYKSSPTCMELISALFDVDDIKIYRYFLVKTRNIDRDGIFTFVDPNNIHLYHTSNDNENLSGVYELADKSKQGFERVWRLYNNNGSLKSYIQYTQTENFEGWILYNSRGNSFAVIGGNDPIGDWVIESSDFSESVYSRFTDTEIDDYDLKFCKVLLNDHIEDFINNEDNYRDYESVTAADPYWNGDRSDEVVKSTIMKEKFNFVRTKYFSIDIMYDLSELSVQRPYLYGMIFDEEERPSTVTLNVDAISSTKSFKLNDLICYLLSLSFKSFGMEDRIPTSKEDVMELIGFDFEAAIEDLQKYLFENGIDDVDLNNFIPTGSYTSFTELMEYYKSNRDLRKHLVDRMENADNKRIYEIYKTIYDATMIQNQTNNLFIESKDDEYTESEDIILYYGESYKERVADYSGTYTKYSDKEWRGRSAYITYSDLNKEWQLKDLNDNMIATLPDFESPIGYWNSYCFNECVYTRFPNEVKDSYFRYRTYQEFIEARDPILGKSLRDIDAIADDTTKLDTISTIIISSIEALESVFNDSKEPDIVRYAFSNLGSVSLDSITLFIRHLVEFFKSFTVQLAEMNSIFKIGAPFDNKLSPIDGFRDFRIYFRGSEIIEIQDQVNQILSTKILGDNITILDRVYIDPIYDDIEERVNQNE